MWAAWTSARSRSAQIAQRSRYAHHVELEALLVKADARITSGVGADVRRGHQAARLHVLDREAGLEHDDLRGRIVGGHEHRGDDQILARRQSAEVDERRLQLDCGEERAVVGLVDRTRAVRVGEQCAGLVERVGVWVVERRRERQRGWAALIAAAMDSALERPEADPLALEDEAFA